MMADAQPEMPTRHIRIRPPSDDLRGKHHSRRKNCPKVY